MIIKRANHSKSNQVQFFSGAFRVKIIIISNGVYESQQSLVWDERNVVFFLIS